METITNKMLPLNETEISTLTTLLVADLMNNQETDILNAIGVERVMKFVDKINATEITMTPKEQADTVIKMLDKMLHSLNIN